MALEMKPECKSCSLTLGLTDEAWICSHECTYCAACAARLERQCSSCGGELVRRPRRGRVSELPDGSARVIGTPHRASIEWQRGQAVFTDRRYSRVHTWRFDGGVELRASASPQIVPAPFSDAAAVDPEAAFMAALSSCHLLWFLDRAATQGLVVESYSDEAEGSLLSRPQGHPVLGNMVLRPRVRLAPGSYADPELLNRLHHEAHERCFLANALEVPPRVEPTLEPHPPAGTGAGS